MRFLTNESGAVTVDWVVLTAALVGLGLATMAVVSQGVENASGDIDAELKRDDIIKATFTSYVARLTGVQDKGANYWFATPRCGAGSTPDTCFSFYDYTVEFEAADGSTITWEAREMNKSKVEWESTFTDADGKKLDPATIDFGEIDCVEASGYKDTRKLCLSTAL